MKKDNVLNRNFEFRRVYQRGACLASRLVVTYALKKKRGAIRTGITAGKKVGNAVERNRARRIVKAAAAEALKNADGSFDVVFVCRSAAVKAKSTDILPILVRQLKELGVTR